MKSMTGFAVRETEITGGVLSVSIKSLNHRSFECVVRAPTVLTPIEGKLRSFLRETFQRGKIELSIFFQRHAPEDGSDAAQNFIREIAKFEEKLSVAGKSITLDASVLLRLMERSERPHQDELVLDELTTLALVKDVAVLVDNERGREGEATQRELRTIAVDLRERTMQVQSRSVIARDEKVKASTLRLKELLPDASDERIFSEASVLAEKLDIAEEIARLLIHYQKLDSILSGASVEGVGREIEFLSQELLREWNTIASKSQDASIAHDVVTAKLCIEKIREQAANVL